MDARLVREGLLTKVLLLAQAANIPTKASAYIHAALETRLSPIDLQTMRDIRVDCARRSSMVMSLIVDRMAMDAFEQLAADIFWADGYWVRTGVKVNLTREDKARIGRQSSPRWEIDLVAYRPATNELLALECKSYLDSGGVHAAHFEPGSKYAHRYKLFHDPILRDTVLERLREEFAAAGLCPVDAAVRLGLIHAHATPHNAALLAPRFADNDWLLYGPDWLRDHLERLARGSYENSTAAVVAKLLLRSSRPAVPGQGRPGPAKRRSAMPTAVPACH